MTIEDLISTSQDAGNSGPVTDLETLVRTLANHAQAADQRSAQLAKEANALAERIALLEGSQGQQPSTSTLPKPGDRPAIQSNGGRILSTRVAFARRKGDSSSNHSSRSIQREDAENGGVKTPLEIDENETSTRRPIRSTPQANNIRKKSPNCYFVENGSERDTNGGLNLNTVMGVPEDDPTEALADRVLLIERQLENHDEEAKKDDVFD
mmetsp:Transcript_16852/g.36545  ORF Transcript_16852/g.36545 Transcript_16852/m.36545 type:complete len:210 (-) Transcript_16852:1244-1873(-)